MADIVVLAARPRWLAMAEWLQEGRWLASDLWLQGWDGWLRICGCMARAELGTWRGEAAPSLRRCAMFAIAAIVLFAIAAFVAFTGGSVSVIGLVAVGLACLAVHLCWPWTPWAR